MLEEINLYKKENGWSVVTKYPYKECVFESAANMIAFLQKTLGISTFKQWFYGGDWYRDFESEPE